MKCPRCDTEMIWNNDFDVQELTQERYDLLSCHQCPECKAWVEVYTIEDMRYEAVSYTHLTLPTNREV